MCKRWALWLVLLHVATTTVFVVREEVAEWDYWPKSGIPDQAEPIPRWMTVVNAWAHGISPPSPPVPDEWAMSVDFWPSLARKGYYVVELPVAFLVGWYHHPLSAQNVPPLLPLGLLLGTHHLGLHTRIIVFEALMIAIVALHWQIVVWVLRRKARFARWVRIPIIGITAGGVLCALGCLLPHGSRLPDLVALLALGGAAIGWVFAFGASAVYIVWSTCGYVDQRVRR
jgi:hypothetical protein